MKPRLLIISDLWGDINSDWLSHIRSVNASKFEMVYFDARKLAAIDLDLRSQEEIHRQFTDDAIEKAVHKLISFNGIYDFGIGCSIGGTILWKAAEKGLNVNRITTLSATKLRHISTKPTCAISVYYGTEDPFRADEIWAKLLGIENYYLLSGDHHIYRDENTIKEVFERELV